MRTRILLALLIVGGSAQASDWVSIGKSANGGTEGLVDVSSIVIVGEIRRAWFKVAYVHHKAALAYTMERDAFDCPQQIMRAEAYALYFDDGTHQDQSAESFPEQWTPVPPDTMGSTLMQFMCAWKPR